MEPTEPMEWVTVTYAGVEIRAANFLDGVLARPVGTLEIISYPGWYIQKPTGDMDGPMFRKRKAKAKEFAIILREYQPN